VAVTHTELSQSGVLKETEPPGCVPLTARQRAVDAGSSLLGEQGWGPGGRVGCCLFAEKLTACLQNYFPAEVHIWGL